MTPDSLLVRVRVSMQALLSLLLLVDTLCMLYVALHCWEELRVRTPELINEAEFMEN